MYQGYHTSGLGSHDRGISSAFFHPSTTIPNQNENQNQEKLSSYHPSQPSTTPSYHPLQQSAALPYHPSVELQRHDRQTRLWPNDQSTRALGSSSLGTSLLPHRLSYHPSESDTVVPNEVADQTEHQLIPKNGLAFESPVQGATTTFGPFPPSTLSPSHLTPHTVTAVPYHYVVADQVAHPLIPMHAVANPISGTSFASVSFPAGSSAQPYHPMQLNAAEQNHYGGSSAFAVGNGCSGMTPVASFGKLTPVPAQHPTISTAPLLPGTAGPNLNAVIGNLAHRPKRSDSKISVRLPSCPEGKPCILGLPSSLCKSCSQDIAISLLTGPPQAQKNTPLTTESWRPLTTASSEQYPLGSDMSAHCAQHYPRPTLTHVNLYPLQRQYRPSPNQSFKRPSCQTPPPGLEPAQPKCSLYECQQQKQRINQLEIQVLGLQQKVQQLQSQVKCQQQSPGRHEQKLDPSHVPPTSQRLKSPGHVSPMNHSHDTQHELQRYIEEVILQWSLLSPWLVSPLNSICLFKNRCQDRKKARPSQCAKGDRTRRCHRLLKRHHALPVGGDRKKLDDELVRKIKSCREENPEMSYDELARKYGVAILHTPNLQFNDG
ncbi:MAG: hypothetical protein J3Q66DRAFT_416142 [Benniella sp.]|nr:MAG: hypothetical protein J3Q66DRAFT_416142 [Benniella sp.]